MESSSLNPLTLYYLQSPISEYSLKLVYKVFYRIRMGPAKFKRKAPENTENWGKLLFWSFFALGTLWGQIPYY